MTTLTLADTFLRTTRIGLVDQETVQRVQNRLRYARKFVFNKEASFLTATGSAFQKRMASICAAISICLL